MIGVKLNKKKLRWIFTMCKKFNPTNTTKYT